MTLFSASDDVFESFILVEADKAKIQVRIGDRDTPNLAESYHLSEGEARELRDALTRWLEHIERQSRTEAIGFIKRIDAERDRRKEAGLLPMTWDELQSFE